MAHSLSRTYRDLVTAAALCSPVLGAAFTGCSSPFDTCEAHRNCPAGSGGVGEPEAGSGGTLGEAGANSDGGADTPSTRAGSGGRSDDGPGNPGGQGGSPADAGSGGEGGSPGPKGIELDNPCERNGELACAGPAQKLSLICRGGRWQPNETCASDENCDAETGVCAEIVEECADREPGERYCNQDTLIECGLDRVSMNRLECEGRCIEESGVAKCATPFCSDGKIQPPERCDDGNTNSWDGCSDKCVVEVVALALGRDHSCALGGNGKVKCWGENSSGQLGLGDLDARGDQPGEMGDALPDVDLGSGRSAKAISATAGGSSTCAILDDNSLKCWGTASGLGDEEIRGDERGEMGDSLPAIDLGSARTVKLVSPGWGLTCALLDDLSIKCWGRGGVLGLGDLDPRGNKPNQMGNALPRIDLGTGRTAKFVAAGYYCGCAILDDNSLKCWGKNSAHQLGLPDGLDRGDEPLEMGDRLPSVNVGMGRTATLVRPGHAAVCAILDDGSMKCWGTGPDGGFDFPQMGDTVPRVNLGVGRTALDVEMGYYHFCALLDDASVKCWGGESAVGASTLPLPGYAPFGDSNSPPPFNLGKGRSARILAVGGSHTCALLDDGTVRCWGYGSALGIGRTGAYGIDPSERGDALIPVDLVF